MRALLPFLLLPLAGCGQATAEFVRRPAQPVAWPAPAALPRVEFEFSYRGAEDVERHGGFLGGLGRWIAGSAPPRLAAPYGIAVSPEGRVYVTDTGLAGVHELELATGAHRLLRGDGEPPLRSPVGVALAPDGRLFVTDSSTGRVHVLARDGETLAVLGSPEELGRPTGIACDAARGRMLLTDTTGCRILALDLATLAFTAHGGRGEGPGEFNYPTNLALDAAGRVYVTDSLNFRVQVLSSDLEPLSAFGRAGSGPGCFAKPKGIALDAEGHVYVVDGMFDNVQVFDARGELLLAVARSGAGPGELSLPTGLAIDAAGRIFVADAGNARLSVFRFRSQP